MGRSCGEALTANFSRALICFVLTSVAVVPVIAAVSLSGGGELGATILAGLVLSIALLALLAMASCAIRASSWGRFMSTHPRARRRT